MKEKQFFLLKKMNTLILDLRFYMLKKNPEKPFILIVDGALYQFCISVSNWLCAKMFVRLCLLEQT